MRKAFFIFLAIAIVGCTSIEYEPNFKSEKISDESGNLFLIGGGRQHDSIMSQFLDLAPADKKNVLIVPFANQNPEKRGQSQCKQFMKLGATVCNVILCDKDSLDSEKYLGMLDDVNLVFFLGGSQATLLDYIGGSEFLDKIVNIYKNGGVIGGNSAGAASMSKVMITGKEIKPSNTEELFLGIDKDNVETAEGLGFFDNVIIDQHFLYRKRHNRLFSVLLNNPGLRGVGIDEGTAIIVDKNKTMRVIGESYVMVIEPNNLMKKPINEAPVFTIRLLSAGDKYELSDEIL